jgi:type I restriction enzyme S subunit
MILANGRLPASWRSVALGEVLERIEAGTSFKAQDRPAVNGEVGVLKVSAVTWNTFRPSENKALLPECDPGDCPRVRKGDLLISRANTTELIAAVVMAQEDYPNLILSDKTLRLVPKKEAVCPHYLLHVLRTPPVRRHFERYATGTSGSMRNISQENIAAAKIPLPPLSEQQRLGSILDKAEAIRRKRQEGIRLTESLIHSAFLEMFGDPIANPKRLIARAVGELAEVQGGLQLSPSRREFPIRVPYLRVANVYRDRLLLDEVKEIDCTAAELERVRLRPGDILLVEGHGNREEIGRSAVWDGAIDPCVHQNHLIRVRARPGLVEPVYMSAFLNSAGGRRQLVGFGKTTSGLNTISVSNVRQVEILTPPVDKQRQYASLVSKMKEMVRRREQACAEATELFASLVQRAFRGEL